MRPAPSAIRMIVSLLAFAAAMVIGPATAAAVPTVDGEFTAPGIGLGTNNEIALGADGNMWVTLEAGGDYARITPSGEVTPFEAVNVANPVGITAGPGGTMWVTQANGVARFSTDTPATATVTAVPIITASAITIGPDGNLWTAADNKVYKIPPAAPDTFSTYPVVVGAKGITSGTDGNLWVADFGAPAIVSVTTAGVATPHPISSGPQGIAAGPNGQVAFSDPTDPPHEIGRLTAGGTPLITEVPNTDPFGVTFGTDQAYWFANFVSDNIGRLTTDGAYTTLGGFTAASGPRRIAAGAGNTLWVTLSLTDKIARVTGVDPPAVDPDPDPPTGEAPKVTIDRQPAKKVEAKSKKAKVKFRFSSPTAGAKFECSLAKRGKGGKGGPNRAKSNFKPCTSPAKYELKPGHYTFSVRASAGDLTGKAESAEFKVVKQKEK